MRTKTDYYCGSCGITFVDKKMNCMACGDWLGGEE
jgi:predicted ATP-dependent serine protease